MSQAPGNPAELGRTSPLRPKPGKAAREAAPKRSDAALEALTKVQDQSAAPLDVSGALMPRSGDQRVEAYRQRRDAMAAVNLPIYLDDREPRKSDGVQASGSPRPSQAAPGQLASPVLREATPSAQTAQLDALYRSLAGGAKGAKPIANPANEEWLRQVRHSTDESPVFAQPAL